MIDAMELLKEIIQRRIGVMEKTHAPGIAELKDILNKAIPNVLAEEQIDRILANQPNRNSENVCKYKLADGSFRVEHFDIYQTFCGSIHIVIGISSTILSKEQIKRLDIPIRLLKDFSYTDYSNYYKK